MDHPHIASIDAIDAHTMTISYNIKGRSDGPQGHILFDNIGVEPLLSSQSGSRPFQSALPCFNRERHRESIARLADFGPTSLYLVMPVNCFSISSRAINLFAWIVNFFWWAQCHAFPGKGQLR